MKWIYPLIVLSLLISCSQEEAISPEQQKVKELERQLSQLSEDQAELKIVDSTRFELIGALYDLYKSKVPDSIAAGTLDKIHLTYTATHNYVEAAHIADTILKKYPKYVNRPLLLESQANNYDMFILPRDAGRVKYYLETLLKENPNMPADRRADFEYRLKYVDLTIDEVIQKQIEEGR